MTASPKTLPPKLFYDDEGCRLFYEITRLPEYYLTRTEKYLLADLARSLVPEEVSAAALVEFGGSDEDKARHLLDLRTSAGEPIFQTYVSIDVAASALALMQSRLRVLLSVSAGCAYRRRLHAAASVAERWPPPVRLLPGLDHRQPRS